MAANPNSVTITGNVTRDPEVKILNTGATLVTFSLANNRSYKDRNDEWQEETSFFDVTCWAALAEATAELVEKGMRVQVVGRLKQDSWEDKDTGDKRSKVAIVADDVSLSVTGLSGVVRKVKGDGEQQAPRQAPKRPAVAPDEDPF